MKVGMIGITVFSVLLFSAPAAAAPEEEYLESPAATALGISSAPLLLFNNRVFTWVSVNGSDERLFFVDNGWSQTTVDANLIEGQTFRPVREVQFKALDRRDHEALEGAIDVMQIGNLTMRYPHVRSSDLMDRLSREFKKKVHGVLAWETMRHFLTTFDFQKKRVYFSEYSPTVIAAIHAGEEVSVFDFGPHCFSSASLQIFSVKLEINGVEVDACVDLGYPGGLLTTLDPKSIGIDGTVNRGNFPVAIAGHQGRGIKNLAKQVQFGHSNRKNVNVVLFESETAPDFVIIGVEFLKQYKVTFDYRNRKLYVADPA